MLKRLQTLWRGPGGAPASPAAARADAHAGQRSDPQALRKQGNVCLAQGDLVGAVNQYEAAIAANPDDADVHIALGFTLSRQTRWNDARHCLERAVLLAPGEPEAHYLLGVSLLQLDRVEEASASLQRALALNPGFAEAHHSLAMLLRGQGRWDESLRHFDRALALAPDAAETRLGKALVLLLRGQFAEGLDLFESRLDQPSAPAVASWLSLLARRPDKPFWNGEPLHGRRLLVWVEEGLGDCLMMMRYLPLLAQRGAHGLVILADPSLERLMQAVPNVARVVHSAGPQLLDDFDVHCAIMSLPRLFGTRADSIPATVPYLAQPPAKLIERLARPAAIGMLQVGLVWAGNQAFSKDRLRSLTLSQLQPLMRVPGVQFVSLQKGPAAAEAGALGWPLLDCMDDCADFLDTAALVSQLDLVISVDTAVAHLAGALGKPVWLFNRWGSEWRWQLDREDSPWYPSMRLFNQAAPGDWTPTIAGMAQALAQLAGPQPDPDRCAGRVQLPDPR